MQSLGQYVQLATNLSVLVGLVLVGIELHQNTTMAKAEVRAAVTSQRMELLESYRSPEFIALSKRRAGGEALSADDEIWLSATNQMAFRFWESVYYQYRIGLYDESDMESYRRFWGTFVVCTFSYIKWYSENRLDIEPNFRREMDRFFEEAQCDESAG